MTAEQLEIIITAQNDEFKRRIDEVNSRLDDLEHNSDNATNSMGKGFKTLAGIISTLGITKIIGDMNDAYTTQMMNEVKLETVMRNRIKASDEEIDSIKRLTSAQQELGIIGDEVQLAGAQQLATFATSASTVETLIPAMNNLMAQQNGFNSTESSAVSIANMMGKALQGQTSALTRVGISFTEAQENVLKYGTEAEKAATMAQVITDNVGNMNEALRNTSAGQLQAVKNDFGDLKEQIGATFQPLLTTIIPMVNEGLQTVSPMILSLSSGIAGVAQYIAELSPTAKTMLTISLLSAVAIPAVTKAQLLYNAANAKWNSLLNILIPKQRTLNSVLKASFGWLSIIAAILGILASIGANAKELNSSEGEAMQDTADGADAASASVDGLADSYAGLGDSADSAKKSLLDIDTLNVFDGGAASTGGVDFAAVTEGAENAQDMVAGLTDDLSGLSDELDGLNGLSLDGLGDTFSTTFSDIGTGFATLLDAFNFDSDTQLESLRVLNEKVQGIFGKEWTTFWEGVGSTIYQAFFVSENTAEHKQALEDVNNFLLDVKALSGRNPLNAAFQDWWFGIFEGLGAALNDFQGLLESAGASSVGDFFIKYVTGQIDQNALSDEIKIRSMSTELSSLYQNMSDTLLEYLKQGKDAQEALDLTKADYLSDSAAARYFKEQGYDSQFNYVYAHDLQQLLEQSGQITPQYQFADYSGIQAGPSIGAGMLSPDELSSRLSQMENGNVINLNLNLQSTLEVDGDKMGESVTNYQTRENAKSNGY